MTVAELIHRLETFPPEARVLVPYVIDEHGIIDWGDLDEIIPSGQGDRIYLS